MRLSLGATVRHTAYGIGTVVDVFGDHRVVNFFGERVTVLAEDLQERADEVTQVQVGATNRDRLLFRRACYEAINLGVVPPHPDQLLKLSIGGSRLVNEVHRWLEHAPQHGLCKAIFGNYGSGKSHHLRVAEAAALTQGWVVSFVEFDPKQADPAKPHLVYRAIVNGLRFPQRVDGSRSRNFYDLVGEARRLWNLVRVGRMFQDSPWFEGAMSVLRFHSHSEDPQYVAGVNWLGGQVSHHAAIKSLSHQSGGGRKAPPQMPRTLETAEIYVQHLVVLNEWCRALGYKGLLIVLDEAEHVRGFAVNRRNRATNFFDLLARSAHSPTNDLTDPGRNEHGISLPAYWKHGPHFALLVALTEGETFSESHQSLRDACVFVHSDADIVRLDPPSAQDYQAWCTGFFEEFVNGYPETASLLRAPRVLEELASTLAAEYAKQSPEECTLRVWVKAATLVPSLLLVERANSVPQLEGILRTAARQAIGELLPWEI